MYNYQSSIIADLAAQLKRGPRRLSVRQLSNIEFILSVIEAGKSYPFDFILHALTGFRARGGDGQGSTLLGEESIRADLVHRGRSHGFRIGETL